MRATRELGGGTDTKPRASQELAIQKGKTSEEEITLAKEETTDTQAEDAKKVPSPVAKRPACPLPADMMTGRSLAIARSHARSASSV